jgi:hypothetical protein
VTVDDLPVGGAPRPDLQVVDDLAALGEALGRCRYGVGAVMPGS